MKNSIEIRTGSIATSANLMRQLPEFDDPHDIAEIAKRIHHSRHLNLIAFINTKPVGFKLGYERNGGFYSWLGGVLPEYRRLGIARKLADEQEIWARQQGYKSIFFKTRNRHKAMLLFSIGNGFNIYKIEKNENIAEYRISLRKDI